MGIILGGDDTSVVAAKQEESSKIPLDNKHNGKELGVQLLLAVKFRKKGTAKEHAVRSFITTHNVLGGVAEKYVFVIPMFGAIIKNNLHGLRKVLGKATELNGKEGRDIGESLARSLAVNTQATAAVDAWIGNFPALKELDEEYEWFRPIIESISYKLLEEVPWGLKMRVTVGAITSMADLLTDVYVTYMFWIKGKEGYFKASLASLAVSFGIQIFMVWVQNRKLGFKKVLKECIPIFSGFKPALDAYRITQGEKQEAGQAFDPLVEMTFIKGIEVFAEAIPGVIIQLMAIATNTEGEVISSAALLSLTVSALTTGFSSATISYDWDTDPLKREQVPDFYGYVPPHPTQRATVFVFLIAVTFGMLLIRCMTIVVLALISTRWVFLYLVLDILLYLIIKVLRGDFWYWVPAGGSSEIFISILLRIIVKIISDFTLIVQLRHPNEVGGAYWIFGFVLTMGSLPVAIQIAASQELGETAVKLAVIVAKYFMPLSIVCLGFFFLTINRQYWHTFFSMQRGKDLTVQNFKEGNDAVKAKYTFKYSKRHWISIEEDVKAWVSTNWEKWEEEKPEWFDDNMKKRVPIEYIPTGEAKRRESVRRASVDAEAERDLGGALRASIRRASIGLGVDIDNRVVPIERDN